MFRGHFSISLAVLGGGLKIFTDGKPVSWVAAAPPPPGYCISISQIEICDLDEISINREQEAE